MKTHKRNNQLLDKLHNLRDGGREYTISDVYDWILKEYATQHPAPVNTPISEKRKILGWLKKNGYKCIEPNSYANDFWNVVLEDDCIAIANGEGDADYLKGHSLYTLIGYFTYHELDKAILTRLNQPMNAPTEEEIVDLWNKYSGKYSVIFSKEDFWKFIKTELGKSSRLNQPQELSDDQKKRIQEIVEEVSNRPTPKVFEEMRDVGKFMGPQESAKERYEKAWRHLSSMPKDMNKNIFLRSERLTEAFQIASGYTLPNKEGGKG